MISGRLDEVHARQVARSNDRQTTSNTTPHPDETPENVWYEKSKNHMIEMLH